MRAKALDKAIADSLVEVAKLEAQIKIIKDKMQALKNNDPVAGRRPYSYPMWFKAKSTGLTYRFDSLHEVVNVTTGQKSTFVTPHTNTGTWTQVPKPEKRLPWKPTMPTWCWCWNCDNETKVLRLMSFVQEFTKVPNQYVTYNHDGTKHCFDNAEPCSRISIPAWFPSAWISDDNK